MAEIKSLKAAKQSWYLSINMQCENTAGARYQIFTFLGILEKEAEFSAHCCVVC